MTDGSVAWSRVITGILWCLAGAVTVATWITWLAGQREWGYILGLTLIPITTVAGVSQVRCYALRVCGLIRVSDRQPPDLHALG